MYAKQYREDQRQLEVVVSNYWLQVTAVFPDESVLYRGSFPSIGLAERIAENEALVLLAIGSGKLRRVL